MQTTGLASFTAFLVLSAVAWGQSPQQPTDETATAPWNGEVIPFDAFGANGSGGRIASGQTLDQILPRQSLRYVIDVRPANHARISDAVDAVSPVERDPAECIRQLYEGRHETQEFSGPDARAMTMVELLLVTTDGVWRLLVMDSPLVPLQPLVWLTDQDGRTATFVLPARDKDAQADAG